MTGIFNTLYVFFYDWLFGSQSVTYMTAQGQEFACILLSLVVLCFVLYVAILPLKAILSLVFRGW